MLFNFRCEVGEDLSHIIDPVLKLSVPMVLTVLVCPAKEGFGDGSPPMLEESPAQIENPILNRVPLCLDLIWI